MENEKWKHKLSNIDPEARRADCANCGRVSIRKSKSGRDGWRCNPGNPKGSNGRRGGNRAGDPQEGYKSGTCPICKRYTERLVFDHDHKIKPITLRGWICHKCNLGIGQLQDDPTILQAAIRYLQGEQ